MYRWCERRGYLIYFFDWLSILNSSFVTCGNRLFPHKAFEVICTTNSFDPILSFMVSSFFGEDVFETLSVSFSFRGRHTLYVEVHDVIIRSLINCLIPLVVKNYLLSQQAAFQSMPYWSMAPSIWSFSLFAIHGLLQAKGIKLIIQKLG